jgi:hypothetical protein
MKTLKSIMMGLALLLVCNISKAAGSNYKGVSKDDAINTYLNAVVHGKLAGVEDVIADGVQFNMIRGDKVTTMNKEQLIGSLKAGENTEQDCKCSKSVVQDNDDATVTKVEMKYTDFTRIDVITTQKVGNGWKITKVDTSFK